MAENRNVAFGCGPHARLEVTEDDDAALSADWVEKLIYFDRVSTHIVGIGLPTKSDAARSARLMVVKVSIATSLLYSSVYHASHVFWSGLLESKALRRLPGQDWRRPLAETWRAVR